MQKKKKKEKKNQDIEIYLGYTIIIAPAFNVLCRRAKFINTYTALSLSTLVHPESKAVQVLINLAVLNLYRWFKDA